MNRHEDTAKSSSPNDAGIRRLSRELNREDSQLRLYLLDAALAGLRLTRNPLSLEVRRDAAKIWTAIEPILAHHLDAEDRELLPWLNQHSRMSPAVGQKIREYHDRLRKLLGAIVDTDAGLLTDAEACEAGRALSGLAVNLDDAIDDEERRLFPSIQRALFESGHRA